LQRRSDLSRFFPHLEKVVSIPSNFTLGEDSSSLVAPVPPTLQWFERDEHENSFPLILQRGDDEYVFIISIEIHDTRR
jgi:hypothetical protein